MMFSPISTPERSSYVLFNLKNSNFKAGRDENVRTFNTISCKKTFKYQPIMEHNRDSEEIRKVILDALSEIKTNTNLNYDVRIQSLHEEAENIILTLERQPSGISKVDEEGENYTRSGAKIVFHQIFSNGTEVSYKMSHIEGLTEEPKMELQDHAPRKDIDREYIMQKVLSFLEDVLKDAK